MLHLFVNCTLRFQEFPAADRPEMMTPDALDEYCLFDNVQIVANFGTETFVTDVEEIQADIRQRLEDEIAATPIQQSSKVHRRCACCCYLGVAA